MPKIIKASKQKVEVPESWLQNFADIVQELQHCQDYILEIEEDLQDLVDCVMAQGKMLEEVGIQPLSPNLLINMAKYLDHKERELTAREKDIQKQIKGSVPPKKEWN